MIIRENILDEFPYKLLALPGCFPSRSRNGDRTEDPDWAVLCKSEKKKCVTFVFRITHGHDGNEQEQYTSSASSYHEK